MTYTYNPSEIVDNTVSRARFELGDTIVDDGGVACMLCDEEIDAIIKLYPWKKALYLLAEAVCMKLSYETDWDDDNAAFRLSQRAERWQTIRDRFRAEAAASSGMPKSGAVRDSLRNPTDGGHAFRTGMMQSPFVKPPTPYSDGGG